MWYVIHVMSIGQSVKFSVFFFSSLTNQHHLQIHRKRLIFYCFKAITELLKKRLELFWHESEWHGVRLKLNVETRKNIFSFFLDAMLFSSHHKILLVLVRFSERYMLLGNNAIKWNLILWLLERKSNQ